MKGATGRLPRRGRARCRTARGLRAWRAEVRSGRKVTRSGAFGRRSRAKAHAARAGAKPCGTHSAISPILQQRPFFNDWQISPGYGIYAPLSGLELKIHAEARPFHGPDAAKTTGLQCRPNGIFCKEQSMSLSRRDFVKLCTGTAAGYGVSRMFHPAVREALAGTLTGELPPVFWLQGQGCTGCSVSILNSMHPAIAEVLLKIISLDFHPTIMADEGAPAIEFMRRRARENDGGFFIVVEGAVSDLEGGRYCVIGESGHEEITMSSMLKELAPHAAAVLAVGACAAYGGVSAARGAVTGAMGVGAFFGKHGIATPVVNIPGCPPHPDWMVGTLLVALDAVKRDGLEKGLASVVALLDEDGRPKPFYGANTHENCPYLYLFDEGVFSEKMTDKSGCRYDLGCKGPFAMCDSPVRRWNGRVNWCVENAVCIGCVQPDFPDGQSPFYEQR